MITGPKAEDVAKVPGDRLIIVDGLPKKLRMCIHKVDMCMIYIVCDDERCVCDDKIFV